MKKVFADNASDYFESGYNIIPLRPLTKIPAVNNWQVACEVKQPQYQVDGWVNSYPAHNIGLPLGEANNIIAIDFDYNIDGLHDKLNELLDGSPVKKKGDKGFTAFYQYNGEHPKKWYKDGQAVIELLAGGNQTVVPPSIHPDTKEPYIWLTPDTLFDIKPEELPKLPVDFIEQVDKLFGYERKVIDFNKKYDGELPPLEDIEKAMSFIPSHEYATWITVGMALNHNYGDAAFNAWDTWSRKAPNYDDKGMQYKWQSFGKSRGNPVTIGTLFHYATGNGYIIPRDDIEIEITSDFKVTCGKVKKVVVKDYLTTDQSDFPGHLLNAPGLPGQIAAWIDSTAIKRQPILSLGAAICAAGTIFAHRVKTRTNLRTNFMVLGLAESGCGKEHARDCVDSLFDACDLSDYVLGEFASDVGMISALKHTNGIGIAMIDELGRELKALNGKGAASHEARILTTMMKMFSKAGGTYRGKQYANHNGDMDRKDLNQPCLSIYGTTVPKRFFDALTSDDAIDGFLARWLVFQSNDIDPALTDGGEIRLPPQDLMDNVKYINDMPAYAATTTTRITTEQIPNPKVIPFTDGAERILQELTDACGANRVKEIRKGGLLAPIWARTREHAIKLALVAHPYRDAIVESVTMSWACDMAMHLSNVAIKSIRDNVADNEHEKVVNRIHTIIMKFNDHNNGEAMPHYRMTRSTQFIKMRDRTEILTQLQESGRLEVIQGDTNNNKPSYSYKAVR